MAQANSPDGSDRKQQSRSGQQRQSRGPNNRSRSGKRRGPVPTPIYIADAEPFRKQLDATLADATYIIFDIETTGGNPEKNGITEIFAIKVEAGKEVGTFYSMVNPRVPIPPIVRRMTGITNQMVRDAPLIEEVMPKFVEFVGSDVLVSHNTIGDMKFVRYFAKQTCDIDLTNFYLCTHLLVEKLVSEAPDKSLKGLAKLFEFAGREFHRAEADARLTEKLFNELVDRLTKRGIKLVSEAVRLQGDLESGLRLGWAIDPSRLTGVPQGPGVFYLFDHERRLIFFSSALSLARDIKGLKRYHQLPRALLRLVLQSYEIEHESHSSNFAALVAECEALRVHNMNLQPSIYHQRCITAFCLVEEVEGLRLTINSISRGTIAAFGPVRDRKLAQKTLDKIAKVLGLKVGKKGIMLERSQLPLIQAIFTNEIGKHKSDAFWEYLKAWNWFSRSYWKQQREQSSQLSELEALSETLKLEDLLQIDGFIAIRGQGSDPGQLYEVVGSRPKPLTDHPGSGSIKEPDELMIKSLKARVAKLRSKPAVPLSEEEAPIVNALLWWILTSSQRRDGKFIPVGDRTRLNLQDNL